MLIPAVEDGFEFVEYVYEVGGHDGDDFFRRNGWEYGLVLEGRLEGAIGFAEFELEAGDSIAFDSSAPHRFWNAGDVPARAVWVWHNLDGRGTTRPATIRATRRRSHDRRRTRARRRPRAATVTRGGDGHQEHRTARPRGSPDAVRRRRPATAISAGQTGHRRLSRRQGPRFIGEESHGGVAAVEVFIEMRDAVVQGDVQSMCRLGDQGSGIRSGPLAGY